MQVAPTLALNTPIGLENILHKNSDSFRLPDFPYLQPSDRLFTDELSDIFSITTLDDYIYSNFRTVLRDTSLLTPKKFRNILLSLSASLILLAKKNPKSANKIGKLISILDNDKELFDLLNLYRSALIQG